MMRKWIFGILVCGTLWLPAGLAFAKPVSAEEGESLLKVPRVWILDVRSYEEYASGHLPGAYQIPVQDLSLRRQELPADKAIPIFVYCRTGKRSAQAENLLTEWGHIEVYTLKGGLPAWEAAGKPVSRFANMTH